MTPASFPSHAAAIFTTAAGRRRHDHHAVIIRADDVARLDGNTPMTIG
ncbi:hypothetical protein [Bradyrhizobium tunisiense]